MQISGARAAAGISDNIQKKTGFRQQSVHSKRQYIKESYENVLDDSLKTAQKKRGRATATDFLMIATKKVMERYPDVILLSVNDDRRKGNQKTAINFEFFVK